MMLTVDMLSLLLVVVMVCDFANASQLEIQAFQPAVVPIRQITTLTLKTSGELNVTSNTSLQCRFKDISVPARKEDGFIFCDTPPIKNTDKVSLYLDVDGQLFKTKKPLYFHEPFKVSNITPTVVAPAQNIHLSVNGISCKDWMQYFVRFQTPNGTKKTQQGICKDSVVSCYVPEFPPNTLLRVGLTLSNRLVEWARQKILVQYPIDAMQSPVKDIEKDIMKKGAFTFLVELKDRFSNSLKVNEKDNKSHAKVSVQYSSQDGPKSMQFLECSKKLMKSGVGDQYTLNCAGAEQERIFFYPSINNVPIGGQAKYEASTTLCPGKSSCEVTEKSKTSPLAIILGCVGGAIVVLLIAVILHVYIERHYTAKYELEKRRKQKMLGSAELELVEQEQKDVTNESTLQQGNDSEGMTSAPATNTAVEKGTKRDSTESHLGACGTQEGCEPGHQGCDQEEEAELQNPMTREGENDNQSDEGIEMDTVNMRSILNNVYNIEMNTGEVEQDGFSTLLARLQTSADRFSALVEAGEDTKCNQQEKQGKELQSHPLILIEQMERDVQEIDELCKEQEDNTATKKTKDILHALRLAFDESNRMGRCSLLALIEDLHENVADLGTVAAN